MSLIQSVMIEYQTRNIDSELKFFNTLKEAITHADEDNGVWKISWIDEYGAWVFENMSDIIANAEQEHNKGIIPTFTEEFKL